MAVFPDLSMPSGEVFVNKAKPVFKKKNDLTFNVLEVAAVYSKGSKRDSRRG
jgi:hypothetical protein